MVGERRPSQELTDPARWTLRVGGAVDAPLTLTLDNYLSLDHQTFVCDVHCVTGWTRFATSFTGVPLRDLIGTARPRPEAAFVSFAAYSDRDHHVSLPLGVVMDASWLVHQVEGESLTTEHGGPVRVVTTGRYFYKSLKWVKTIELLAETPGVELGKGYARTGTVGEPGEFAVRGGIVDKMFEAVVFCVGTFELDPQFRARLPFPTRVVPDSAAFLDALREGAYEYVGVFESSGMYRGEDLVALLEHLDTQRFDELEYARRVAKQFETEHHEFVVRPDAMAMIPKIVRHYGEPYADSSAVASFHLAQLARQPLDVGLVCLAHLYCLYA